MTDDGVVTIEEYPRGIDTILSSGAEADPQRDRRPTTSASRNGSTASSQRTLVSTGSFTRRRPHPEHTRETEAMKAEISELKQHLARSEQDARGRSRSPDKQHEGTGTSASRSSPRLPEGTLR